jgi:catechol 2,3-dioxygenase-like lactoylglutathione lyase family enzyme
MIAHLSIGVANLAVARRFYDAALLPLGYSCKYPSDDGAGYSAESADFWLNQTSSPVPADPKSGLHICFAAPSREAVDAFYAAGMVAGGKDNGKPGLRPDYGPTYYAAFIVDPDGYRIEAHCGKA